MANDDTTVTCLMSGGPQDGIRYAFDILPILLVDKVGGCCYQRTDVYAPDGATIFEYHRPNSVNG